MTVEENESTIDDSYCDVRVVEARYVSARYVSARRGRANRYAVQGIGSSYTQQHVQGRVERATTRVPARIPIMV